MAIPSIHPHPLSAVGCHIWDGELIPIQGSRGYGCGELGDTVCGRDGCMQASYLHTHKRQLGMVSLKVSCSGEHVGSAYSPVRAVRVHVLASVPTDAHSAPQMHGLHTVSSWYVCMSVFGRSYLMVGSRRTQGEQLTWCLW